MMRYSLAVIFSCILTYGNAQTKKEIKIGESFPYDKDLLFNNGIYKSVPAFKGMPIIVELFGSTCSKCFEMLPKIDSFQKKYKERLQYLLVGYDDGKIQNLYRKFRDRLQIDLTVAFSKNLFETVEYSAFPTYIWISPEGIVESVTMGSKEMNENNIEAFLSRRKLAFGNAGKKVKFDYKAPYLLNGNGGPDTNFLVRSLLGKWDDTLPIRIPLELAYNENSNSVNILGSTIKTLYTLAYWGKLLGRTEDSIYGKVWPSPIITDSNYVDNRYCYTASYRGAVVPDLSAMLRSDLYSYFNYKVSVETREMPCWIVRCITKEGRDRLRSSTSVFSGIFDHAGFDYKHIDISYLISLLDYYDSDKDMPFIDETGINYPIDLKVEALLTRREDFFSALKKEGIVVVKTTRSMKVLVLTKDKNVAVH